MGTHYNYTKGLITKLVATKVRLGHRCSQTNFLDVEESFNRCLEDLGNLQKLSVPRYVLDGTQKIFLHGFSDASIRAYGCCFYVTVTNECNISS